MYASKSISLSLLGLLLSFSASVFSQDSTFFQLCERVKKLSRDIQVAEAFDKIPLNDSIRILMKDCLADASSLEVDWSDAPFFKVISSPDKSFRIYNWGFQIAEGVFQYYAMSQYILDRKKGKIAVHEWIDVGETSTYSSDQTYSFTSWRGAIYYSVIKAPKGKSKNYLLLGWDGNGDRTKTKVIEVLHFDRGGVPSFGAPIIKWMPEGQKKAKYQTKSRLEFEYASKVNMTLIYDRDLKMVVFDHLAPTSEQLAGYRAAYVPDFSYDGLRYKKGKWYHLSNIDARNNQGTKVKKYKPSDVGQ